MPKAISGFTRLRLADGVSVVQRGPSMVQFGLDATRTGIVETGFAEELCALFDAPFQPRTHPQLIRDVGQFLDAEAARSLVADLLSYRILVPAEPRPVVVFGTSALAEAVREVLSRSGFVVRSPLRREPDPGILAIAEEWWPLVIVDHPRAVVMARLTKQRTGPVIPVTTLDSRVCVGPIRLGPGDPCPACLPCYLVDRDAGWLDVAARFPSGPAQPDPVVLAAGATATAAMVRRAAGYPDPPGVSAPSPEPGQIVVVDPFGPQRVTTSRLLPHPRCPVCY